MKLHTDLHRLKLTSKSVVTIGSFDGVHMAHRHIISQLKSIAAQIDAESVIITFNPHPRRFFEGESSSLRLITTTEEKCEILESLGVDHLVILPFEEVRQLTALQFSEQILIEKLNCAQILAGYNHRLGSDRVEGFNFFLNNQELNITPTLIPRFECGTLKISSTVVRNAILDGDIERANLLLEAPFAIKCSISENAQLLISNSLKIIPPKGRYNALLDGENVVVDIVEDRIFILNFNKLQTSKNSNINLVFVSKNSGSF